MSSEGRQGGGVVGAARINAVACQLTARRDRGAVHAHKCAFTEVHGMRICLPCSQGQAPRRAARVGGHHEVSAAWVRPCPCVGRPQPCACRGVGRTSPLKKTSQTLQLRAHTCICWICCICMASPGFAGTMPDDIAAMGAVTCSGRSPNSVLFSCCAWCCDSLLMKRTMAMSRFSPMACACTGRGTHTYAACVRAHNMGATQARASWMRADAVMGPYYQTHTIVPSASGVDAYVAQVEKEQEIVMAQAASAEQSTSQTARCTSRLTAQRQCLNQSRGTPAKCPSTESLCPHIPCLCQPDALLLLPAAAFTPQRHRGARAPARHVGSKDCRLARHPGPLHAHAALAVPLSMCGPYPHTAFNPHAPAVPHDPRPAAPAGPAPPQRCQTAPSGGPGAPWG